MTTSTSASTPPAYRWVMLSVLWLGYVAFGMTTASIAPLITPISAELGLNRSAMGFILGAWALVYIFAAIPAGAMLDRFGTRRGLAAGLAIVALSGFARALAIDGITLFLAVAIFGIGGPLLSVGSPKLIAQWFGAAERGTAIGIYMTGPFIGTAFALATANSIFMPLYHDSWRLTIGTFALLTVLAIIVWIMVAREPPGLSGTAGAKPASTWTSFKALLRRPLVNTILVMALAAFMFNHALSNWLPEILRAGGMDAATAGYWASVPTLVGIVCSLTIPRLATPRRRVNILSALYVSLVAASLLLAFTAGVGIWIALILLGFARLITVIVTLILMESPGVDARNTGAAAGLYFTAGEIGGVLGPTVLGVLADATGGFAGALVAMATIAGFLVVMTLKLRRELKRAR